MKSDDSVDYEDDLIPDEIVKLLRCCQRKSLLSRAGPELIDRINQGVTTGGVINRLRNPEHQQLDGGLINDDSSLFYPVYGGILTMVGDQAIPLDQVSLKEISGNE